MGASESKLKFKEDVFRLARDDNIPADSPLWAQFYTLPEAADDVFALWSPNDVRSLTLNGSDRPPLGSQTAPKKNFETLIYSCIARLRALQHRGAHADPHQPIAPEVLNCIRVLTRLYPYIYEAEHLEAWEHAFFWQPRKPQRIWDVKQNKPGVYFDGLNPAKKYREEDYDEEVSEREIGPPLGEQLIDLLVRYMFFPGFTLPKKLDADGLPDLKVSYHIWNSGIGCRQSIGMTKENERNAVEVIRLLLSMSSRQLYIPPRESPRHLIVPGGLPFRDATRIQWPPRAFESLAIMRLWADQADVVADTDTRPLSYLTAKPDRQVALSMICSLLNTVLKYNPAQWRIQNLDFMDGADPKARLVHLSLQLLLVLVLYPDPKGDTNEYRKALGRLHRVEDFQFIQQGLTVVLTQPISGVVSYLPGDRKMNPWASEMLILFWELLQCNRRFRAYIIETDRAHDFVVLVLYYAMEFKDTPSKQGFVRMCVLILQTMSVEPAFGARLNKPFLGQDTLPAQLRINNFHGSYADFLITSIHTLMTTTQGRLEAIYPALLAIINNIAPYARDLQRATSCKLLDLFISLSSPTFLFEKEHNNAMLLSLLEAMNAILEHQYETNRRFVEVIVRSRKRFQALRDFTVEGALAELDRQAQDRKDRGEGVGSGVRSPVRGGSLDSVRSPVSARSPQLDNVPENGAFAIGEDDDDEENDDLVASRTLSGSSAVSVEDAVPLQSRSMSEKARGKQPVGQGSFSRTASRNTSTTSLTALNTPQISQISVQIPSQQQFTPTAQWLETWLPHLPLHTILSTIDHVPIRDSAAEAMPGTTTKHPGGRIASEVASPKVQAFQWTSLSLGWYLSLLWGLIYASDVATNRGVNGIWTGTSIRLFNVVSQQQQVSLRSPKGAVDAVGNSIAQRLGSLSFGSPTVRDV